MNKNLEDLNRVLIEGQRRSSQGSYMRRNPSSSAVPFLLEARSGLKEYVSEHQADAQGWRLLSQAEECLLNYSAARQCLERAMSISDHKEKRDLKKLALLKEYESQWAELNLSPSQLDALGEYLRERLVHEGCDHTLRSTKKWLNTIDVKNVTQIIEGLRNQGGYCDCEVLNNVACG